MNFPCVKVAGPEGEEKFYELAKGETLIGRGLDTHITLLDHYVSRHHAKIVKDENGYSIVDLSSKHGTSVNGEPVRRCALAHGDKIRLGRAGLQFLTRESDASDPAYWDITSSGDREMSLAQLSSVLTSPEYPGYSDLEKMNFILDFHQEWSRHFSAKKTFQHILQSALRVSGADRGFVLVKHEEVFDYAIGMNAQGQPLPRSNFRACQTIVNQVAKTNQPVFHIGEMRKELAQIDSAKEMNLQALACLPLSGLSVTSDTPTLLGILYLDSTKIMHSLSGLEERILNRLAVDAGNVLEKVEMIRSFEERKRSEREMAIAHEVQKSLLPRSMPRFANLQISAFCEPTRHVGGDFYDFLESHELVGVLADVSGKGVPAALLSALTLGVLNSECRSAGSCEQTLERVNQHLCKKSRPNDFVTLFLFRLDPQGQGGYASAGHNPAYLFRALTGEIEELESTGLVLGALDFASFRCCPLRLDPGDVLVVYSDGVTEATNPQGILFGESALKGIIKSEASAGAEVLKRRIVESLESFTSGTPQSDDVTFMVIHRPA